MENIFIKEIKRIAAITIAFAFLFSWVNTLKSNIRQKEDETSSLDIIKVIPRSNGTPVPSNTINPIKTNTPIPEAKEYSIELSDEKEIINQVLAQGIDLNVFKSYNTSTIAAIAIPGTRIYYPVCYPFDKNNEDEWLDKNFSLKHSYHGVIYLDSINNPLLSDHINSLYGHNMKDGSMFAEINKYLRDDQYIKDRQDLFLITEDEISIYSAIGVMRVPQNSGDYRKANLDKPSDYLMFYKNILANSKYLVDNPSNSDNILELITCSSNHNYRTILFLSKTLSIPNVVKESKDMSSEVEALTNKNRNYHTLYSNIIRLDSENDMLFITDKDDNNYVWTKNELDEKYKEQLRLDAKYISGSNEFGNNGIVFSVCTINGEAYFISKEGEVKKVSEIKISYVPKNEIKTKKIHNLTIE